MNLSFLSLAALLLFQVSAKSDSRIIGGTTARAGQFPGAAAIQVQTATSRFFCGGTLTRNRWILTSGHCVYNATLFTIQLGSTTLTETDTNRMTLASSEYFLHPDFDPETFEANLGVIKLRMKIEQTDYVLSTSFYLPIITDHYYPLVILGWGQTSDSEAQLSEHLQYAEISSLSNEECKSVYGDQISENMVCIEGNYNEGTCTGDNGGALLREFAGKMYIVAVASFVSSSGCESTHPSGFTRVTPYYQWLDRTMIMD